MSAPKMKAEKCYQYKTTLNGSVKSGFEKYMKMNDPIKQSTAMRNLIRDGLIYRGFLGKP